jgi:hypothetical protein
MEVIVPASFAGSVPHAHDQFDEGIYVLLPAGWWWPRR